jgi:membrane-bound lytic murein transglycosylase D
MHYVLALLVAFLSFNILLFVGSILAVGLSIFNRHTALFSRKHELQAHYLMAVLVVILAVVQQIFPAEAMFTPIARVWAASSIGNFSAEYAGTPSTSGTIISLASGKPLSAQVVSSTALGMAALVALMTLALIRMIRDVQLLRRLSRGSLHIRRIGRVRIICAEGIQSPLSFCIPLQAIIAIPNDLLCSSDNLKIAIFHEIQHHRQRDTHFVYLFSALRILCFLNPLVYLWNAVIKDVQEFACDEALIGRKDVSSRAYIGCLLEVAETALQQRNKLDCASSFALVAGRNTLKRRIEAMKNIRNRRLGRVGMAGIGLISTLVLLGTARATQGLVQDRRISMDLAAAMAEQANLTSEFRVVINQSVLQELNRYLGTPEGRLFVQSALRRMELHQTMVSAVAEKYGVPVEFAALPIVESGYRNLPQKDNDTWGAGLWQFIPETARKFGLRVDRQIDERLDVDKATDAAMRLLVANQVRFNSWELSLLAYNIGADKVREAIERTGSRDVWTLIEAGAENDRAYVARVMAAILIMENPAFVD